MKKTTISILFFLIICTYFACDVGEEQKIDRYALVNRHNIKLTAPDILASLSVGNGNFTFTTDITGLQTFYREYEKGVPLGTMSNWGWHSNPNTQNYRREECEKWWDFQGRKVPYLHEIKDTERGKGATNYFRENPHRLHLGIIRLYIIKEDGSEIRLDDIKNPEQELNLWNGSIISNFFVDDKKITVETYCHQEKDMISSKITSDLLKSGRISAEFYYPYGVAKNTHAGFDFSVPNKHKSIIENQENNSVIIERQLDTNKYFTKIQWTGDAEFNIIEKHKFHLTPENTNSVEFCCMFTQDKYSEKIPDFESTRNENHEKWPAFWKSGGAVDFSACTDSRAKELERRTILSQYLIQIQSSGNLPPAETGLTYNSWYGKFHLEMHWWHAVHFAYWNRPEFLENQMNYYKSIKDSSESVANKQGFKGLRWPKMVGPQGMNSPSSVGSYLIWQQPHYIYYAELLYNVNPEKALREYSNLVFETADFMADFAQYDAQKNVYNLLPPLIPAQEHWKRETTTNPPFELAQWHWTLKTAIKWKERLGEEVDPKWKDVFEKLAVPDTLNGVYLGIAGAYDSYTNHDNMTDHPMVLGMLGVLPYWDAIDNIKLKNTYDTILAKWDWPSTWGWDYPMVAMCAVRLGMPEKAIEALLMDVQKNTYLVNGHNYQSERLRLYLPGNGGFLTTISLMCAGWEGCETKNPGFPKDGKWDVRWENLTPMFR